MVFKILCNTCIRLPLTVNMCLPIDLKEIIDTDFNKY